MGLVGGAGESRQGGNEAAMVRPAAMGEDYGRQCGMLRLGKNVWP